MENENKKHEESIYEFVSRFHFPIVGFKTGSNKEIFIGSCVLIRIGERAFLVTASHVMNERKNVKNKELWILNYSDGSKFTITGDLIGNDDENIPTWNDVAIVELNLEEFGTFNNFDFYDNCLLGLDRIIHDLQYQASTSEDVGYLVVGYPCSKNKILKDRYRKPKLLLHLTELALSESNKSYVEDRLTLSIRWDSDNLSKEGVMLPSPHGMSGGGVWLLSNESEVNPMLYAISIAYVKGKKKLISTKMSLVLSLLKYHFPGTLLDRLELPLPIFDNDSGSSIGIPAPCQA